MSTLTTIRPEFTAVHSCGHVSNGYAHTEAAQRVAKEAALLVKCPSCRKRPKVSREKPVPLARPSTGDAARDQQIAFYAGELGPEASYNVSAVWKCGCETTAWHRDIDGVLRELDFFAGRCCPQCQQDPFAGITGAELERARLALPVLECWDESDPEGACHAQ